jgi:GT2 family glycosyltransferase
MPNLDKTARTAIIVAAHRWYYPLYRCIESLRNSLADAEDLIFVDNGSSEMLCNWARERFPGITVLRLEENSLFTGGYNRGLERAIDRGYEYALMVNADTQVHNPAFIGELQEAAERWPRAAFIGPLVYYRSSQCIQKTTLFFPDILKYSLVWLPFRFFPRLVSRQHLTESEGEYLNGVCVLCRVSALKELGLMDESFGGYMEDADWSWRAREMGWKSVFTPVPGIVHFEEKNGYEEHSSKTFMARRNTVLWFLKRGQRNSANAYAILSILLCVIRHLVHRNGESHHSFRRRLKTYVDLLRHEPVSAWRECSDKRRVNGITHEECHPKRPSFADR